MKVVSKGYIGEIRKAPDNIVEREHLDTHTHEQRVLNLTTEVIYVCRRDGSIIILPPYEGRAHNDTLVISHTTRNPQGSSTVLPGNESEVTLAVKENLRVSKGKKSYWEEVIPANVIVSTRTGIYLKQADIMVTIDKHVAETIHHPFCAQKVHNDALAMRDGDTSTNSVEVKVSLIDNDTNTHNRYVIFHGKVILLTPREDPVLESGLYITGLVETEGVGGNTIREVEYFNLEDADSGKAPIEVFETAALAHTSMRSDKNSAAEAASKLKSVEIKHAEKMSKLKMAKDKVDYDRDIERGELSAKLAKRERKLQKSKAKREKLADELAHLRSMEQIDRTSTLDRGKHNGSMEAMRQSETVQTIKFGTALVTAALLAWKLI